MFQEILRLIAELRLQPPDHSMFIPPARKQRNDLLIDLACRAKQSVYAITSPVLRSSPIRSRPAGLGVVAGPAMGAAPLHPEQSHAATV